MVLFGFVTLLSACGELPKPFAQSSVLNNNPLIILDGGGAIKVEMDPDLPVYLSKPLSDNMIESLWEENVPASMAAGFNPRYFLRGRLEILNSSLFVAEEAEVIWALTEINNKKTFEFRYKLSGGHPGWLLLDKNPLDNLLTNMGKDVVRQLYKQQGPDIPVLNLVFNKGQPVLQNQIKLQENSLVQPSLISNDSLIHRKKPKIFLTKVVGAPGDGNNSLYNNIRRMLIIAGVNMVKERDQSDFLLNGFVNVSPGFDALHEITITWLVTTKDGLIVGKVTQYKKIAEGPIRQEWGQEAIDVAVDGSVRVMNIVMGHLASSRD